MKFRIVIDGKAYEVECDNSQAAVSASVSLVDRVQSLVLPTPHRHDELGASKIDEGKLCRSPVAGIVARINVAPGQFVKNGEVVLVAEAMKMENNLTAASAAKVSSVKARVGDAVKAGQILIEYE